MSSTVFYRRDISERESIKIETKTSAKKVDIEWIINKETVDIAKGSAKGEKKGVIGTSIQYGTRAFNLELCVPGWRRSQDGFSAFYLTVPRKSNDRQDADDDDDDFVARYTVAFGRNQHMVTRMSSIRNDFDLGVGFPNFTEVSALINAVYQNALVFNINVEIFECESSIKQSPVAIKEQREESIAFGLMFKMYHDKANGDAAIISSYLNKNNVKKTKHLKLHKCILTAASPVFHTFFKDKDNSSIVMNQWNADIIMIMIRFLYLGKIELNSAQNIDDEDDEDEDGISGLSLDSDDVTGDHKYDAQEEVKCGEEESMDASLSLKKTLNNKVHFNDMSMLLQMECKDVEKLFGLFEIAECYEMNELLIACCHKLRSYVTLETCCIFLIYLDKYSHFDEIKDIKHCISEFIIQNIKTVKSSSGYLYLLQNEPLLIDGLIDKLSS